MVCHIDDLSRFRGPEAAVRDHWASARTEGRSAINCGFGFGLLGHDVDIFSITFKDTQVTDNVRLTNFLDTNKYYDIVYSVRTFMYRGVNCGRQLNSITQENHSPAIASEYKKQIPNIEFYGNINLITQYFQKPGMLVEPRVLPFLYPIPCLPGLQQQGFIPFHWDKTKKEQKIWIYNGRLPYNGYLTQLGILRRLRDHHNYNLKVYKFTNTPGSYGFHGAVPCEADILREFDVTVVEAEKQSYLDVVTLLQQMDLCITFGDCRYPGACLWDIVSLGKPLFYATQQPWQDSGINEIYLSPLSINYADIGDVSNSKVDAIVADPQKHVEDLQNRIAYYSYPNWKLLMEDILTKPPAKI